MNAIFRRELRAYFTNPMGYVVLAVLFGFSGHFFRKICMEYGIADLSYVYQSLLSIVLLSLPFLTMRLFSEEKRQKTDQALLTAPVSLTGIVVGKFLATLLLFIISLSMTLVFAVIIATQPDTTVDWTMVIGNLLGLILIGGLIIAIGLFISSLTESQIIAAIGTLTVSILLIYIDQSESIFKNLQWLTTATNFISIVARFNDFAMGLIYYDNIIFFLSIQALFLFLTVRVLDSKRWN